MQLLVIRIVACRKPLEGLETVLFVVSIVDQHFFKIELIPKSDSLIQSLIRRLDFLSHLFVFLIFSLYFQNIFCQQFGLSFLFLSIFFQSSSNIILFLNFFLFFLLVFFFFLLLSFSLIFLIVEEICVLSFVSMRCARFQQRIVLCISALFHV